MLKKFLKNEKGSITLFVVAAILFFLIVVFSMFMTSSNKSRIQISEIDKIKEEYAKSVENIDQIYQDTVNDNITNLLKVGDYVNYTYDNAENYNLTEAISGSPSNLATGIPQTNNLKWKIFAIHEDGKIDLISETPTSTNVYFKGALGYNNAVLLINDICAKQYSNKELGITARSINLEDIENQFNEQGLSARNAYINANTQYGKTNTYGSGSNQYPNLYAKENGSGINTATTKTDGIGNSDNGYTIPTTETSSTADNGLTATQTYYNLKNTPSSYFDNIEVYKMLFGTNSYYWVASRASLCNVEAVNFGIRHVNMTDLGSYNMFLSDGQVYNGNRLLRPVVTLNMNQIQPSTGTADGTDVTIEHMHQIKK